MAHRGSLLALALASAAGCGPSHHYSIGCTFGPSSLAGTVQGDGWTAERVLHADGREELLTADDRPRLIIQSGILDWRESRVSRKYRWRVEGEQALITSRPGFEPLRVVSIAHHELWIHCPARSMTFVFERR